MTIYWSSKVGVYSGLDGWLCYSKFFVIVSHFITSMTTILIITTLLHHCIQFYCTIIHFDVIVMVIASYIKKVYGRTL